MTPCLEIQVGVYDNDGNDDNDADDSKNNYNDIDTNNDDNINDNYGLMMIMITKHT